MKPSEWLGERFWPLVDRSEPFGCWLWKGRRQLGPDTHSYGMLSIEGKPYSAHRVAWMIYRGTTRGLWVLHRCDVKECVNPSHLYLGDIYLNNQDARARGSKRPFETDELGDFHDDFFPLSYGHLLLDEDLRDPLADYLGMTARPKSTLIH